MSDATQKPGADASQAPPADEIKNLKAEMNRKLENTNAQLSQLLETLKAQTPQRPQPTQEPTKKVSVFDDEEAYAEAVVERAEKRIEKKLTMQQQAQLKQQTVIGQIYKEYPEVNDESGPLMTRAKEIYGAMADDDKASPVAMKAAVAEAAAELGIKPKSKRSEDDDSFSIGGNSSTTNRGNRRTNREADLDRDTEEFARLIGLNPDDPKTRENMKQHSKRNWKRYQ